MRGRAVQFSRQHVGGVDKAYLWYNVSENHREILISAKPAGHCRVDVVAVHFVAREVRQETDVVSSGAS